MPLQVINGLNAESLSNAFGIIFDIKEAVVQYLLLFC